MVHRTFARHRNLKFFKGFRCCFSSQRFKPKINDFGQRMGMFVLFQVDTSSHSSAVLVGTPMKEYQVCYLEQIYSYTSIQIFKLFYLSCTWIGRLSTVPIVFLYRSVLEVGSKLYLIKGSHRLIQARDQMNFIVVFVQMVKDDLKNNLASLFIIKSFDFSALRFCYINTLLENNVISL
ncbi:uncharacterized protein [Henckelia pumila]|uniref:uncharacterized protein n=1 Tax=Henckelia pumila TaxID=405737 RepID=UPI003C6E63A0